jgi:hypothetical protein
MPAQVRYSFRLNRWGEVRMARGDKITFNVTDDAAS